MGNLKQIEVGNHIIAIYQDQESKFDEAFKFLKDGLDKDEIIMIITDRLSKDEIRNRMETDWKVEVKPLESRDIINIKTTQEWYYDHGFPEPSKIKRLWEALTMIAKARNKKGLRVFADTHNFFERTDGGNLVIYECTLDPKFDFSFTVICAYDSKDFESLTPTQRDTLFAHHDPIWK